MSNSKETVGATYNPMDKIYEMVAGPNPSITNALPGDRGTPTLENLLVAQEAKHEHYFKTLGLKEGMKLLDIGCGWGPFLDYCRERGVHGVGLTLSSAQYNYLVENGHEVYYTARQDFESDQEFDAVSAIGSIEHFVSPDDVLVDQQDAVYQHLFQKVSSWLKPSGTFGGQFMTWAGDEPDYNFVKGAIDKIKTDRTGDTILTRWKGTPPPRQLLDLYAEKGSKYYHLALLAEFYPGSRLPRDFNHFYESGSDAFDVIEVIDGREQYIWTMACWGNQFRRLMPLSKWRHVAKLLPKSWYDPSFKMRAKAFWERSNRLCFINHWMGHEFFFLRKK